MIPVLPTDIANQSLDVLGSGKLIGDIGSDGTPVSETARRQYGPCLRDLLRAAHWTFARKRTPLLLLGDRLGQTLAPDGEPYPMTVEPPWQFAYAWPVDAVQARWMPWDCTPVNPQNPPIMPNLNQAVGPFVNEQPARFLVGTSDEFPVTIGQTDWDALADLPPMEGAGYIGRKIILTNVPNARLVYTQLVLTPEQWDAGFHQAMVARLASFLALNAIDDRKVALAERDRQIAIAKDMVREARVASANEAGFPQSTDHTPDWIRARRAIGPGYGWGAGGQGAGYTFVGWQAASWSDGTVY